MASDERLFPIMKGPAIPWSTIAPHERQALRNHSQTLERLAARGGLSPCEAVAILEDREWERLDDKDALRRLDVLAGPSREIRRLQDAIRAHRDARGDDRCWRDDETLYAVLPEGYTPPERDTAVELARCEQFIASRQHPQTVYVSPQAEIDRLRAALVRFSQHGPLCPQRRVRADGPDASLIVGGPCSCGLAELLVEAK